VLHHVVGQLQIGLGGGEMRHHGFLITAFGGRLVVGIRGKIAPLRGEITGEDQKLRFAEVRGGPLRRASGTAQPHLVAKDSLFFVVVLFFSSLTHLDFHKRPKLLCNLMIWTMTFVLIYIYI